MSIIIILQIRNTLKIVIEVHLKKDLKKSSFKFNQTQTNY